ncbi:DNA adenine methylase [Natronocella acetinitrilica]|uniref:DNA adenine methylase n=1 Tax=Natronocella acetinitrilica TaxID=414046 RepID=A0AAE3KC53_9GAMM|nr:DNA adenine methylase [Natronocella acetinitrilica]MCP1674538.1 DNA adenine methylase [Natronocella acetinitrilica]
MITRPVLRYHGGKWRLAPWIIDHLPPHRAYVEPYGGAASVLLRKERSYAEVYNDLAGGIVNVFRVLRDADLAASLERALRLTPFSRREFEDTYGPTPADPVEWARQTIFRSMAGFGSAAATEGYRTGFRSNSSRSGTTPAHDWQRYPEKVAAFTERLRGVVIESRPAIEVMQQHDGIDTLHYVDPPYPHGTRRSANRYNHAYEHEMCDDAHRALGEALRGLKGMIVLSGYPCDLYDQELFPDWRRITRRALADGARERTEVLWLNAPAAAHIRQQDLFRALPRPA